MNKATPNRILPVALAQAFSSFQSAPKEAASMPLAFSHLLGGPIQRARAAQRSKRTGRGGSH